MPRGKKKKLTAEESRLKFLENLKKIKFILKKINRKYVWGLDISLSNTGLYVRSKNSGAFSHKLKGTQYQRIFQLEKEFKKHVIKYPPKLVVYEGYAFAANGRITTLAEATYAVKRCFFYKPNSTFPAIMIAPTALKKFATGSGRGVSKKDIKNVVIKDWKVKVANDDEADAYVLSTIAMEMIVLSEIFKPKKNYLNTIKTIKNLKWKLALEDYQWDVIYTSILNDGDNVDRFYL